MNKKRFIIGVAASFMILTSTAAVPGLSHGASDSPPPAATYGPFAKNGETLLPLEKNIELKEYQVSDEYEINYIRKTLGDEYADRLKHRHTTPLAVSDAAKDLQFTTSTNGNWGGYIVTPTSTPKGVGGSFKVPTDSNGLVAPWTGVGGFTGSQLVQTGVLAGTNSTVITKPLAWTEALPAAPIYWFEVNPGDQMYSSVSYDADTSKWNLLIQDTTTGDYYATQYTYSPAASAEWVIEGLGSNNIGNFTVNFTGAFWNDSSWNFRNIDYDTSRLYKSTLTSPSGQNSNAPSSITGGSSFSISR
ncbi:hypothetical protein D3C75_630250 [compost metagenome]